MHTTALLKLKDWFTRPCGRLLQRLHQLVGHPIALVFAFTVFSLTVKECYPFSHFPMYSSNGRATHYFYLQDANGQPIPASKFFRISVSNVKKIYHAKMRLLLERTNLEKSELTSEHRKQLGESVLDQVLALGAPHRREEIAQFQPIQLVLVEIERSNSGFEKRSEVIASR